MGKSTHVDFAILEALLQVVVDGLVRDLADQRQIRDSHLLLLGGLENSFGRELGLLLPRTSSSAAGSSSIFLAPGALSYRLHMHSVSVCRVVVAGVGGLYHG